MACGPGFFASQNLVVCRPGRVRIVYLSGTGQLGGAERCLLDVMQSVHHAEPSWTLTLVASRDGPLVEAARGLGFSAVVVPIPDRVAALGDSATRGHVARLAGLVVRALGAVPGVAAYRRRLRAVLAGLQPDVVHTNGYKMHIIGAWSRPSSSVLIWHLHDYVSSRPLMARAMNVLSRRCDAGIAVSASVAQDFARLWHGRTPVRVVMNAVDLETFSVHGPRADLDALAGLPPAPTGTVRVGLVATLGRFKGHDVFLRAIARLPRSLPVRAYVVSGSLYETRGSEFSLRGLRALADELGVADRVGFTGFVSEPAAAMRALDVIVHATTTAEPFGLVIAEGMACGRAVITSATGGAAEVVAPGVDALTHAPGDVDALAAVIARLVADAPLRARLGAAGRLVVEQRFNRVRLGAEIVPIYRAAVAARAAERRSA
ncbi:MAG TPA: glycosyltransferase family 4 protein [Gemmatimonadaceae bacterium]|nr:glycosyltransferase family 4 protein [Gemmatimonadaceae bacterium]